MSILILCLLACVVFCQVWSHLPAAHSCTFTRKRRTRDLSCDNFYIHVKKEDYMDIDVLCRNFADLSSLSANFPLYNETKEKPGRLWIHECKIGDTTDLNKFVNMLVNTEELRHLKIERDIEVNIAESDNFGRFQSLNELYIQHFENVTIQQNALDSLPLLDDFRIIHNKRVYVEKMHLQSLIKLEIISNKYFLFPKDFFEGFPELKVLNLYSNNLTSLDSTIFHKLSNLIELDLSYNNIENLPKNLLTKLTNLEYLILKGNRFKTLDSAMFSNLSKIFQLDLSYNNIYKLPNSIFENFTNLWTLNLNSNNLTSLNCTIFINQSELRLLYLSNNKLSKLPFNVFDELTLLREINLNNNRLSFLDNRIFSKMTSLTHLELGGNRFKRINGDVFKPFQELRTLNLRNNGLSTLDTTYLKTLVYIDLSNNHFEKIPKYFFYDSDLETLKLDYNKLTALDKKSFGYLTNLRTLSLVKNKLSTLDSLTFKSLSDLLELDLSNNNLEELPKDLIETHCLISLHVNNNNLRIDPFNYLTRKNGCPYWLRIRSEDNPFSEIPY